MKDKKLISEAEIQQALQKFKQQGGLIKQLPEEIVPAHNLVGTRWAAYEIVQEGSAGVDPA